MYMYTKTTYVVVSVRIPVYVDLNERHRRSAQHWKLFQTCILSGSAFLDSEHVGGQSVAFPVQECCQNHGLLPPRAIFWSGGCLWYETSLSNAFSESDDGT